MIDVLDKAFIISMMAAMIIKTENLNMQTSRYVSDWCFYLN